MAGSETDSGNSTIEQTYQKKTPLEHILLRPDTYVGSLEHQDAKLWVWNEETSKMTLRSVSFVPGLYKIFDEILVNAADNYQRDRTMNKIDVKIDPGQNCISVWNNGKGIPVAIHQEYKIYVPEMIFGQLLTSSNYDDSKKKVTGGRNGYGAKLANVFSTKFIVETADSERMMRFHMEWSNNMREKSEPKITRLQKKEDYTCITFFPDLQRLKMETLDADIVDIMSKRVYDLAGCTTTRVKVWLNDKEVNVKNFQEYMNLYLSEDQYVVYKSVNNRWDVGFTVSDSIFQQVSFVNSICTIKGGTHVTYIADQLTEAISGVLQKKHKKLDVKPAHIKQHMWLFVNALVENPTFDSQTKETLTLKASQFGSKCDLDEDFIKEVLKSGIVEQVAAFADAKTHAQLSKKVKGNKKDKIIMAKLEDANDAGSKHSEDCTLILTEGDSAKTLVLAGFEVIGRDRYGVFPLRGKLLNVREATVKQLMENEEIQNIMKIMGLQPKREYANLKDLRYGSIMAMADQDLDGSHIKGLIINFIHFFWPGLLKTHGFLKEFITPIVKATSKHNAEDIRVFYTVPQFENWSKTVDIGRWNIKYYKGLGTSTSKEAKEYFSDLARHKLKFVWRTDAEDGDAIDLAFSKKRADDRKRWLEAMDPDVYLDMHGDIPYSSFINQELILFSQYDNVRSIPSLVDGLKPGHRKIMYACFKRNLKTELKVAQLSGYVAEKTGYHHGEISLAQTIVGLAQNFVGSNNINLLQPLGQFGTRAGGGKDHASPRYIFTALSPVTRYIFCESDDALLTYQDEEGLKIEPHWYVPIIPMVLVNGADGIGTGWSTSVPQFNPFDLIDSIKNRINGVPFDANPLKPWYKGFKGTIETNGTNYEISGAFERMGEEWLKISELPLKKWTSDYKLFLAEMLKGDEPFLGDIKEYHTECNVHFEIRCPSLGTMTDKEIIKKFKLVSSMSMANLVLFNKNRRIVKYEKISAIMEEHFQVREEYYHKRKAYLVAKMTRNCEIITNKVRFILMVTGGEIIISLKQKKLLCKELKSKGFTTKTELAKIFNEAQASEEGTESSESEPATGEMSTKEFDYLLGMPLWTLTLEEVERLKQEKVKMLEELEKLKAAPVTTLWERDLDALRVAIEETWQKEQEDQKVSTGSKKPPKRLPDAPPKKRVKKDKENSDKGPMKQTKLKPPVAIVAKPVTEEPPKKSIFDLMREKTPALQESAGSGQDSSESDFSNPFGGAAHKSRIRKGSDRDVKASTAELKPEASVIVEVDDDSDSSFDL